MNYSRQLAVYGYTGDCVAAQVSSKFLFAVTNNGLETYTVRLYSSAAETCTTLVRDGSLLRYRPGSFGSDQSRALSLLGASSLEFIPPKGNSFAGEDEYQKESQLEVQEEYFCSPPEVSNGEDTNIESVIELGNVKKVSGRKFMRKLQSNKKFSNSKAGNSANIDEWTSVENEVSELSLNDADKDSLRLPSSVYDIRELLKVSFHNKLLCHASLLFI